MFLYARTKKQIKGRYTEIKYQKMYLITLRDRACLKGSEKQTKFQCKSETYFLKTCIIDLEMDFMAV